MTALSLDRDIFRKVVLDPSIQSKHPKCRDENGHEQEVHFSAQEVSQLQSACTSILLHLPCAFGIGASHRCTHRYTLNLLKSCLPLLYF